MAGAEDVNGDGRADVIIGAFDADNNGRFGSGSAYVLFGKATTGTINLAALNASAGDGPRHLHPAARHHPCHNNTTGIRREDR